MAQARKSSIIDVRERRRSANRGKQARDADPETVTIAEEDADVTIDHDDADAIALVDLLEPDDLAPETLEPQTHGPMGNVDALDSQRIHGWAWYPETPNDPAAVEILVGDRVILTVIADRFRDDLLGAEVGNGCHGFLVDNILAYLPPGTRTITVRRASDAAEIPGSPVAITWPDVAIDADDFEPTPIEPPDSEPVATETDPPAGAADPEDAQPIGNIDRIDYDEISGWAWDPAQPNNPIDIEILDDDVVVLRLPADQHRADLAESGVGNGRHGFAVRNLVGIFPLSRHRVRVRRAADGLDLPESPAWITQPGLDFRSVDFIDQVIYTAVQAATKPEDLAQPLGHLLRFVAELINTRADLARAQNSAPQITPAEIADGLLSGRTRELVETIRHAYRPLHFDPPAADTPVVSVIIPVHNKFAVTYDCLKSIHAALPTRSFEIIIVDDCSDDETLLAALTVTGAARILRNTENLGFVRSCNAGAAAARGQYLLFLNNDTLVQDGWLDELVETFEQIPNVGIAGAKLLFADGKLQEAGGIIWRLGDGWNWGRGSDPDEPAFSYLRDADWVSGAALMIPAALFNTLAGFDPIFAPGYYEDTDLAFRVRALGKRVVMQPAARIIHLEGVSSGTDTSGPGMKRFQVINHAKFYKRWKDTLLTHRFNGHLPEEEAERHVGRRAYFIDDSIPTPDQDAGSNAAVEHMRTLIDMGYKVTFLPADNMSRIDPYTQRLQKIGIECLHHPWFWSVEEVFRKARHKPDLVYLHRYTNASKYATMVRRYFPDCRIVYNVADLHFLRMERQAEVETGTITQTQVLQQRRAELGAMMNVDCTIVHSSVEAAMLHAADPTLTLEVVPWTVRPRPTTLPFAQRAGLAFVGGFGHPPNVDAVRYLLDDIHPVLRRMLPGSVTYLIGSKMPEHMMNMRVPGVVPVGFVPVLAEILHKVRLTVVPLRYGAGIKGKVLESFAHGLPCVMSEVAAEGLDLPDDLAWLVATTPAEFADKIARVHEDEAFNRALSASGLAYIESRYSAAAVKEALRAAVGV
jgi:O-antigen biosynthesis protein